MISAPVVPFAPPSAPASRGRLTAGDRLDPAVFERLRRRLLLEGCKWDPQVGDTDTLAAFPLWLDQATWWDLSRDAEALAGETLMLENAVLARPDLWAPLGLPRAVRRALSVPTPLSPSMARVMRFDFHPTPDGWRLSEVNSDVPGGYTEASFFSRLMAVHHPGGTPAGDPADALVSAITAATAPGDLLALLAAPGYLEDQQIISFLAQQLRRRDRRTVLANPAQLTWPHGRARLAVADRPVEPAGLIRFFQAEWLVRLPQRFGWEHFFRGGLTPVTNSGLAVISENKRLPLLWDRLGLRLPAWRRLLPETRDPREAPWFRDDGWLLKSAYSNTGDAVGHRSFRTPAEWREMCLAGWLNPRGWIAQRRFISSPVDTPAGPRHACLGVYTVDGRAAGAYARLAPQPLIDFEAVDAALLISHAD